MDLVKQTKSNLWLGALQVQVSNSFFYLNMISTGMMILTFWYTAGYQIQGKYLPWLTLWLFIGVVAVAFAAVMVLDYKFVYPSRQAFVNEQACKHNNPWMDEIMEVRKDIAKIKAKLEIE